MFMFCCGLLIRLYLPLRKCLVTKWIRFAFVRKIKSCCKTVIRATYRGGRSLEIDKLWHIPANSKGFGCSPFTTFIIGIINNNFDCRHCKKHRTIIRDNEVGIRITGQNSFHFGIDKSDKWGWYFPENFEPYRNLSIRNSLLQEISGFKLFSTCADLLNVKISGSVDYIWISGRFVIFDHGIPKHRFWRKLWKSKLPHWMYHFDYVQNITDS